MSVEVPGKILEEYAVRRNRLGLVEFGGTRRPIFLDLVPDAHVGDYVRVHVGFATERVSEAEALRAYQELAEHEETAELALQADESTPDAARRRKPR
ncbi:MAG TPA: HypC/HybG/HupF family hydrogenase formation chaperone [Bryobacteraceae bacterium]|jgi:hydrogenase expression/formation protein HypC|nr:HypC/HybG/HupF family hydrogenase formation chaperone [Bryobacteraceae bacterium]